MTLKLFGISVPSMEPLFMLWCNIFPQRWQPWPEVIIIMARWQRLSSNCFRFVLPFQCCWTPPRRSSSRCYWLSCRCSRLRLQFRSGAQVTWTNWPIRPEIWWGSPKNCWWVKNSSKQPVDWGRCSWGACVEKDKHSHCTTDWSFTKLIKVLMLVFSLGNSQLCIMLSREHTVWLK